MAGSPGPAPGPCAGSSSLRLDAQALTVEYFRRIDAADLEGAVDLYAVDGILLGARGRHEILQVMRRGLEPNATKRSRHLVVNVRSSHPAPDLVLVELTAVACTMDDPGGITVRSVLDQEQVIRRRDGGGLEIVETRIPDLA